MQQTPTKRLTPDDEEYYVNVRIGRPLPPMQPAGKPKAKRKAGKPSSRFRLIVQFWQHPETAKLPHAAQAAWCYLWTLADGSRSCYPSLGRISRRLGCSRAYVQKLLAMLRAHGFLAVLVPGSNYGKNRANLYQLRLPGGSSDVQL